MHKVIVFTDIHILPLGGRIIGLDPCARFAQGLAHALENHPDAAHIVISGDLTHHGTADEYARLRALLADCPVPVSLMLGNHDRRAAFLKEFPDVPVTGEGYVQDAVDIGGTRLVLLDTLNEDAPDLHSGFLCAHRLAWAEAALAGAGGRQAVVVTHHPPFLTGFGGMDDIGLHNRDALIERLTAAGNVVQIVSGHVHRTILGSAGGIPVAVFKSTCHQMPMVLGPHSPHVSIDEPGAYGLLLLDDTGVVVHTDDFTLPKAKADTYD